mmetsp:Transcript_27917/g.37113  ORF Transcript_27917/g.37113 Transcript_27917/m.37113 type:complete len:93 (-) Transcript_27917:255-533(-)
MEWLGVDGRCMSSVSEGKILFCAGNLKKSQNGNGASVPKLPPTHPRTRTDTRTNDRRIKNKRKRLIRFFWEKKCITKIAHHSFLARGSRGYT